MIFSTNAPLRLITILQLRTSWQDVRAWRQGKRLNVVWKAADMLIFKLCLSSISAMKNFEWDIVSQNISIISAEKNFFSPDTHRQTPLDGLSVRKVSGMQGQESLQLCVCILRVLRHVALIFGNFATWAYLWKYSHGAELTQHQSLRFTLHQVCISSQISWIWRRCDKRWYYC